MNEPAAPLPLVWDDWLQQHPLAHFVYDTDSLALLAANEAALRRYGYGRDTFLQLTRHDLLLPGEIPTLRAFLAGLPASAAVVPQPVWLERTADGRVLHADIRGMPVIFEGRPARLAAVVDATDRSRDARALAESRQRLAALLGAVPDLWFVVDADGRYEEVSRPDHASLAAPWSRMVGRRLADVLSPEQAEEATRLMAAARASGQTQAVVYRMLTSDGTQRAFEGRCVPLPDGRTLHLVRDVTETAELQERFRAMADAAPLAIFMTDPAGACTYANAAWQALYGLVGEAALGQAWAGALHPEDRDAVYREWLRCAEARQSFATEFRLLRADGELRYVAVRSNPIVRAGGEVLGHVGTVSDQTTARDLEAARRAQAVAEEAGRRQAAFMSRVSHELRTPLNAILGFGQLLQADGDSPAGRTQAYAGHVVQAGRHMLALVDDLLELQRVEQGRLELTRQPVALPALLAACAELLGPAARAEGVQVDIESDEGLEIVGDERCLRQIVLNLGSNAIKYGHRRGEPGHVRLEARRAGAGCRIQVHDDGPGLQPAQLARLFQPFERLDQQAGPQPGSGLGLVITRQLAQRVGGEISLRSTPGTGTTATLELPG